MIIKKVLNLYLLAQLIRELNFFNCIYYTPGESSGNSMNIDGHKNWLKYYR